MKSLSRGPHSPPSTKLLMRILERPGLVAAVRELPGAVLGKLIDRVGLEDAGELVALASTTQLERIFDDDLWQADGVGGDDLFRPERFALWLRVMLEAGEDVLVQRLCELPQDLVALAVHRLVLVLDMDVLAERLGDAGESAAPIERALENSTFEEWEEFRVIARETDAWEDVWTALMSLDRDHHERLRAVLEQCCAMSTEYISGQGGLFQVLTSDEALESDVAAGRDDRRSAEGFISAPDARAFLQMARQGASSEERDPITRAYFRGLGGPQVDQPRKSAEKPPARAQLAAPKDEMGDLVTLLQEAQVIAPAHAQPLLALAGDATASESGQIERQPHLVAPLFEQAMTDLAAGHPDRFSLRIRELGYLVNVWITGGAHEGRRPQPVEALETVLRTCEAGMRAQPTADVEGRQMTREQALSVLVRTPADTLFRRGFATDRRR